MIGVICDFFRELWHLFGWETGIIIIVASIWATRYHLSKIDRNTIIARKAYELNRKFRLKKEYQIKFFCHVMNKFRYFVIKKGTVVLRKGRHCLVQLCTSQEIVPERIMVNHGTNDIGDFVFRISPKRLEETTDEFRKRGFIIKD